MSFLSSGSAAILCRHTFRWCSFPLSHSRFPRFHPFWSSEALRGARAAADTSYGRMRNDEEKITRRAKIGTRGTRASRRAAAPRGTPAVASGAAGSSRAQTHFPSKTECWLRREREYGPNRQPQSDTRRIHIAVKLDSSANETSGCLRSVKSLISFSYSWRRPLQKGSPRSTFTGAYIL
jgi:hypothetical protein